MNRQEKKEMTGVIGIILVIAGITGTIPSAIKEFLVGIGVFGALAVIGIILAIYGFSD